MVTVVDAASLLKDYASHDFLEDRGESLGEEDERSLVDLLVDQIESADVIVLNKTDTARPHEIDAARKTFRLLNAGAEIIETTNASVAMDRVLDTGRFDFDAAHRHPTWFKELNALKAHVPETEEYGISIFVYRGHRPFVPEKLYAFFNKPWPGVVRAKGFFWLATTRPGYVDELSQAGAVVRHQACGYWWAALPKERWPADPDFVARIEKGWHELWGDRRQQLVFIGLTEMDKASITAELDACLLDVDETGRIDTREWRDWSAPFPEWGR